MAFDGSTISTATTLPFSGFTATDTFSVDLVGDVDMVAVTLLAGQTYNIDVDNGAAGDLYLRVFDAFGAEVRANDDGFRTTDDVVFSLSPYLEFTPNYSGTYYVAISTYFVQGYDPFTTLGRNAAVENPIGIVAGTLTVSDAGVGSWPFESAISQITAESASDLTDALRDEGRSHRVQRTGTVDNAIDVDIARMDLTKGDVIVIDVNGLNGLGTVIRVFSPSNVQIGLDDLSGLGDDPELIFGAPSAGSYHVGISGDGNSTYNAVDGTGTVNSADIGSYEVIVHLNPTLIGSSSASTALNGGLGDDYIVLLAGNDQSSGGTGRDTLAGGDDQDTLIGNGDADVMYGEQGNDKLFGGGGNDVLVGGQGNDSLNGALLSDWLEGGAGDDTLLGGTGTPSDSLFGGAGNDTMLGGGGNDVLDGGTGNDTLLGEAGDDRLSGGTGDDSLLGLSDNDLLQGDSGNDVLDGGFGDDDLYGGTEADILLGGDGNDALNGGLGLDTLTGGAGDDVFVFAATAEGIDTITDFQLAGVTEAIDLSEIFSAAGSVVNAGNLAQFIQITSAGAGADSFLAIDANGFTGGSSYTIIALVQGVTAVQLFDASNFIL